MQHRNAPLTPQGRRRLVALVEDEKLTFEAAAAASNVSRSTVHMWVGRWREAGEERRADLSCLEDRSSRPHTSPAMLSEADHDGLAPAIYRVRCRGSGPWAGAVVSDEGEFHLLLYDRAGLVRAPSPRVPIRGAR
jgi:transposase-like protein